MSGCRTDFNLVPLGLATGGFLHHGSERWTAAVDVAGLAAPSGAFLCSRMDGPRAGRKAVPRAS